LNSGIDPLFNYICSYALGTIGFVGIKDNIHAEPETGEVKYGEGTPLARCLGEEEEATNKITTAIEKLIVTDEGKTYLITRLNHKESVQKVKKDVDEILMTRIVPGHCRVCRRLGL